MRHTSSLVVKETGVAVKEEAMGTVVVVMAKVEAVMDSADD